MYKWFNVQCTQLTPPIVQDYNDCTITKQAWTGYHWSSLKTHSSARLKSDLRLGCPCATGVVDHYQAYKFNYACVERKVKASLVSLYSPGVTTTYRGFHLAPFLHHIHVWYRWTDQFIRRLWMFHASTKLSENNLNHSRFHIHSSMHGCSCAEAEIHLNSPETGAESFRVRRQWRTTLPQLSHTWRSRTGGHNYWYREVHGRHNTPITAVIIKNAAVRNYNSVIVSMFIPGGQPARELTA